MVCFTILNSIKNLGFKPYYEFRIMRRCSGSQVSAVTSFQLSHYHICRRKGKKGKSNVSTCGDEPLFSASVVTLAVT